MEGHPHVWLLKSAGILFFRERQESTREPGILIKGPFTKSHSQIVGSGGGMVERTRVHEETLEFVALGREHQPRESNSFTLWLLCRSTLQSLYSPEESAACTWA